MIFAVALVSAALTVIPAPVKAPQPDSSCLHAAGKQTPEQRDRIIAAVTATRAINPAGSGSSATRAA